MRNNTAQISRYILPKLGKKDINEITPTDVLEILREIEAKRNFSTASNVLGYCSRIFRYAVASALCPPKKSIGPCRDLKNALTPVKSTPRPAILQPKEVGELMRLIRTSKNPIIKNVLLYTAYTFCRPSEVRNAEWSEIYIQYVNGVNKKLQRTSKNDVFCAVRFSYAKHRKQIIIMSNFGNKIVMTYKTKEELENAVSSMLDLCITKGWALEDVTFSGGKEFIAEAERQRDIRLLMEEAFNTKLQ